MTFRKESILILFLIKPLFEKGGFTKSEQNQAFSMDKLNLINQWRIIVHLFVIFAHISLADQHKN